MRLTTCPTLVAGGPTCELVPGDLQAQSIRQIQVTQNLWLAASIHVVHHGYVHTLCTTADTLHRHLSQLRR